jgi:hypothetical protein
MLNVIYAECRVSQWSSLFCSVFIVSVFIVSVFIVSVFIVSVFIVSVFIVSVFIVSVFIVSVFNVSVFIVIVLAPSHAYTPTFQCYNGIACNCILQFWATRGQHRKGKQICMVMSELAKLWV